MRKIAVDKNDLKIRIDKNYLRLCEPYYMISSVFSSKDYDWQGDKEGRALLAFVSHYKISGKKIPCMEQFIDRYPEATNRFLFFGDEFNGIANEQQLSGHNWVLRGLLEYYLCFKNEKILGYAESVVNNLYCSAKDYFKKYEPSAHNKGGVSGNISDCKDGTYWQYSTDTGCAFMSLDGLAQYYEITKSEKAKEVFDVMLDAFLKIDIEANKLQTHCCLTAARGLLRMYGVTENVRYFEAALNIHNLYVSSGLTLSYHNYNWWSRKDTWTEPCAVVDSLMVSLELFKITGNDDYRILASRIWHNAFPALQRDNGGAGPTSTVYENNCFLYTYQYEAPFCCTMRLADGLWYVWNNSDLLYARDGNLEKDKFGRYFKGDIMYVSVVSELEDEDYIQSAPIEFEGHKLTPMLKYHLLPKEISDKIKQKIIF